MTLILLSIAAVLCVGGICCLIFGALIQRMELVMLGLFLFLLIAAMFFGFLFLISCM